MFLILFVLLLILRYSIKKSGFTSSVIIIVTYVVSTILGILYRVQFPGYVYSDYSLFSMCYYCTNLVIMLLPLLYTPGRLEDFSFPRRPVNTISYILIFGGVIAVFYELSDFNFFEMMKNWSDVRNEYYENMEDVKIETSVIGKIGVNAEHILFFSLPVAFFFLSKNLPVRASLLIISSLPVILHSLKNGERQSLLLWISYVAFSYMLFRKSLSNEYKSLIRNVLITVSVLLVVLISLISISRFGEGNDLLRSLYAYSGEQPYNAAFFLENLSDRSLGGRLNFPFLFGESSVYRINDYINTDFYLNSFSSIIGSYYKDFGYYTILVTISVSTIFVYIMRIAKQRKSWFYLYVYCLYFNIMFVGVFYNKFTSPPMIRNIILFGIVIWFVDLAPVRKINKIAKKG